MVLPDSTAWFDLDVLSKKLWFGFCHSDQTRKFDLEINLTSSMGFSTHRLTTSIWGSVTRWFCLIWPWRFFKKVLRVLLLYHSDQKRKFDSEIEVIHGTSRIGFPTCRLTTSFRDSVTRWFRLIWSWHSSKKVVIGFLQLWSNEKID